MKTKPDTEVVVAVASFSHPTGSVAKGARLLASDPIAQRHAAMFVADGTDEDVAGRSFARVLELWPGAPPSPPAAPRPAPPPPVARKDGVDRERAVVALVELSNSGAGPDGTSVLRRRITVGQWVDRDDEMVRDYPMHFVSVDEVE